MATGYASARLMGYLSMFYWRSIVHSGQMKSHVHLLMGGYAIESLVVTWIAVMTCSRMHHWLLRDKPLDEEVEEGLA